MPTKRELQCSNREQTKACSIVVKVKGETDLRVALIRLNWKYDEQVNYYA